MGVPRDSVPKAAANITDDMRFDPLLSVTGAYACSAPHANSSVDIVLENLEKIDPAIPEAAILFGALDRCSGVKSNAVRTKLHKRLDDGSVPCSPGVSRSGRWLRATTDSASSPYQGRRCPLCSSTILSGRWGHKMTEAGTVAEWCPEGWQRNTFPHGDHSHAFYIIDRLAPSVVSPSVMLMHEFPGISTEFVQLANTLAQDFRVVVPSVFGRDGDPKYGDSLKQICVRREVHVLARHGVSTAVGWLREFADEHVARRRNEPYGVVGMCFSGNFALALAIDPRVKAAVVAQPSLPVWPCALGLSPDDRNKLQNRSDLRVQGYRYLRDPISPASKLTAAERLLGLDTMQTFPLNGRKIHQHATLTGPSRSEEAINGVRAFLTERLVEP